MKPLRLAKQSLIEDSREVETYQYSLIEDSLKGKWLKTLVKSRLTNIV